MKISHFVFLLRIFPIILMNLIVDLPISIWCISVNSHLFLVFWRWLGRKRLLTFIFFHITFLQINWLLTNSAFFIFGTVLNSRIFLLATLISWRTLLMRWIFRTFFVGTSSTTIFLDNWWWWYKLIISTRFIIFIVFLSAVQAPLIWWIISVRRNLPWYWAINSLHW